MLRFSMGHDIRPDSTKCLVEPQIIRAPPARNMRTVRRQYAEPMRAVVTGAASGIGREVAARLVADSASRGEPARLLLVDREPDALGRVAAELGAVPLV